MTTVIQRSFAGGEIAPALHGRAEQAKYATGLRTCRNFLVQRYGGVTNRAGTRLVAEVKDSTKTVQPIPFVFSPDQTYVLEFGHFYLRVIRQGVLLEAAPTIPYEIVTPYSEAELLDLSVVQSGDVVTIAHVNHPPRELRRAGHTSWALTVKSLVPAIAAPSPCSATMGPSGSSVYRYRVTAMAGDGDKNEESLPAIAAGVAITAATQANPCAITTGAPHGLATGDEVTISGVVGMIELNGLTTTVTVTGGSTCTLDGIDASAFAAYVSGGTIALTYAKISGAGTPTAGSPHVIAWTPVPGAREYAIYREVNGIFGFLGFAQGSSFKDAGLTPDLSDPPPAKRVLFDEPGTYPGTVSYTQQRLCFAGSNDEPETVWTSRTGQFSNFTVSNPTQEDDAVTFSMAGRQVHRVRHLVEAGKLFVLTEAGEWIVEGDSDGVLRPTAINLRQQAYNGAARLPPIVIGTSILYVQARGSVVRDLRYDIRAGGIDGRDLSIFAPHLSDGHQIVSWAFQQIPHSVVWAVRDDGMLIGLTYVREHDVWGWHRHDSAGDRVERVCVVPEGDEDVVYLVVRRFINGVWRRFFERMASRRIQDVARDAFFVDCGLSFDGTNTTATTLTLTDGITWAHTETLTLTASASLFSAGEVGNDYVLTVGSETLACRVITYTSPTVVQVQAVKLVPVGMRGVALATWSRAVDELSGLDHLEGRTVAILADGNVEPQQVVTGGAIELSRPASIVHVGLPIVAELETLDMETTDGETLIDKRKMVNRVTLLVESSRGIRVGQDLDKKLEELKPRITERYSDPAALRTGTVELSLNATWNQHGRVVVRQSDPLPLTVLAIAPAGVVGGG